MPAAKYFRPTIGSAEVELQARIDRLLELNPTISSLSAAWEVRQIGAQNWYVEHRGGCVWLYRAAEKLEDRAPVGVLFWDKVPQEAVFLPNV
jgi:hypothetical protein